MVNLETCLWYSSIFLRCLSFSPPSPRASTLFKATNLAHFLFVISTAWSIFFQILIHIIQNSTSPYFITEHVSTQVAFLQLISKVTMYRVNRKKYFRLLRNMDEIVKNGSLEEKRYLRRYGSISSVVYLAYTSTVLLLATDYCLMPLFKAERDLPIPAWYPFDYKRSTFLYSVAYFHQISVIIMCWLSSGINVMFGVLVFGCCARYKVMQNKLRGLKRPDADQLCQRPRATADRKYLIKFNKKIAELVDLHCEVFDSIDDINDIHTYILFVHFLTSAIMICCAGFQITNGCKQTINSQFIFSAIVCCVLIELLFYFLPGDMLVKEATAVRMAAYDCNWESIPPKYRNYILPVMLRTAKPPRLDVARVTPLILENYASFLATTASYFTSLQAIAGGD